MTLFRIQLVLVSIICGPNLANAELAGTSSPEVVSVQNIEFEVSNSNGQWISLGTDQSPQFLKSVSIKYKFREGQSATFQDSIRDAVRRAAEEKCRTLGAADRPPELSNASTATLSAEISAQQVSISDQQFNGKYTCAVNLKP